MDANVHLKYGSEVIECVSIVQAAKEIKARLWLRKLDAFVMAFWDERESNSRSNHSKGKQNKGE